MIQIKQIIKTAHEVLADKEMLRGFTPEQAAIIGVIGGMSINYGSQSSGTFANAVIIESAV